MEFQGNKCAFHKDLLSSYEERVQRILKQVTIALQQSQIADIKLAVAILVALIKLADSDLIRDLIVETIKLAFARYPQLSQIIGTFVILD